MLKIKLSRFGKRHQPEYRIVVNEARDKRDGKYVALLGRYSPTQTPKVLVLDLAAYAEWLTKGAQPTEVVANLAKRAESKDPFPAKKAKPSRKAIAKAKAAAQEAEAAKNAPKEEAPVAKEAPADEETPAEVAQEAAVETTTKETTKEKAE